MNQDEYKEYLKTDHWIELREKARKRDGNRCRLCDSSEDLNVHHRTYDNLGSEKVGDLTTLCKSCHEKFHDIDSSEVAFDGEFVKANGKTIEFEQNKFCVSIGTMKNG